jgi:hypothetical protein
MPHTIETNYPINTPTKTKYFFWDANPKPIQEAIQYATERAKLQGSKILTHNQAGDLLYNTNAASEGILKFPFLVMDEDEQAFYAYTRPHNFTIVARIIGGQVKHAASDDKSGLDIFSKFHDISATENNE